MATKKRARTKTSPRGKKPSRPRRVKRAAARKPVRLSRKQAAASERDEGPRGWFVPLMEEAYSRLTPRETAAPQPPAGLPAAGVAFRSARQPGAGEAVLAQVGPGTWRDRLAEYKRRKVAAAPAVAVARGAAAAPFVPGARNWLPLGPNVVLDGQTVGEQPVAGRISGIAVAPGGQLIYAASAAGGVFRSDDGGGSWRSLMDGFDLDPTDFASASLACGAIAVDPGDPDRVYVGTGEGDTHGMFSRRVVSALPAYRGIGPIRTDDGGLTWVTEPTASASPDLAGEAFFSLAIDPGDRECVVAATTLGLYRRSVKPGGGFEWVRRVAGVHSSAVVAAAGGTTRFFAAEWGVGVRHSSDGVDWQPTGSGFPTSDLGRIALALQPSDPGRLYAFAADASGGLRGLYLLDSIAGSWREVKNPPDVLPGRQGEYDLTAAIDPNDNSVVYLGGDRANAPPWPGSIWRCPIKRVGSGYRIQNAASIGTHAHADVHVLLHTPGDSNELWCGCDGGVFLNRDPLATGQFASHNHGLSCLCSNFIAQHPTDPNILFTGLQDNGTAYTAGGPIWSHVSGGDGGYCLVNWANPRQVLVFANGRVNRSTSGGATHASWSTSWNFPWATMTQPIVSPPYTPGKPSEASYVAVGAGSTVFVSKDFAGSWPMSFNLPPGSGNVFALAFASSRRLYVGTTTGQVHRADRTGSTWSQRRLDDVAAGPLGLRGLITDVAVDWSDSGRASIYVAFGGMGDRRRVWRFDGTRWQARSGAAPGRDLLDVEHNALTVDPLAPANLYVGADIGVWHSPDRGLSWAPLQNGLPDAPVFDLQIHPTQRLLRAATHGRGLYEIALL